MQFCSYFSYSYPRRTLGVPSYFASVFTRRSGSARRVHCTPVHPRQGLDRSRALAPRSPARLARSNDPHPVQCNGIGERHLSWEIAGVVVVDVGASTSSTLCDRLVSNAATRQGRGKNAIIARHHRRLRGWFHPLHSLYRH